MSSVIKVENLSKQYRLGTVGSGTMRDDLARFWAKMQGKEDPLALVGETNDRQTLGSSNYVWSLKDINFEVDKGDIVGVIGKNGAGKSTLLKILSKVTAPTTGSVKMKGRIASLLEVGTGFHPELTGRENIYLNGAILGMRRHEITRKLDEIIAFAGVERYVDTPVKRYSSGMYVRLAFAVAAHLESEILIIDEVLAVGDAEFQKKCLGKMGDIAKGDGRTILFVSHNMAAIKSLCNKGILLNNGKLIFGGSQISTVEHYQKKHSEKENFIHKGNIADAPGNSFIKVLSAQVLPRKGDIVSMFSGIDFLIDFYTSIENINLDITIEVLTEEDLVIFHSGAIITNNFNSIQGIYSVILSLPTKLLNAGIYKLNLIFGQNQKHLLLKIEDILSFEVMQDTTGSNSNKLPGIVFPELQYKVNYRSI
jgi:lipopolysaccharide transport system ATP-binding protein